MDMAAGLASWCVQEGDARDVLPLMEEGSVQACITSPPYWGLRQYKIGKWVGGSPDCHHKPRLDPKIETSGLEGGKSTTGHQAESPGSTCPWCGATQEGLPVWDGDSKCPHQWGESSPVKRDRQHLAELGDRDGSHGGKKHSTGEQYEGVTTGAFCQDCGAIKCQLGLEPTPELYIEHLVQVFRLVRRVLRDDGLLWVVIGDTRATGAGKVGTRPGGGAQGDKWVGANRGVHTAGGSGKAAYRLGEDAMGPMVQPNRMPLVGYKEKDLVGIPYVLAVALRADGWYWRAIAPFVKTNAMPESTRDRPSVSHEQVLMFAKSKTYYYDRVAVLRPLAQSSIVRITQETFDQQHGGEKDYGEQASGVNANRSARKSLENLARDRKEGRAVGRQWRTGDFFFDSLAAAMVNYVPSKGTKPQRRYTLNTTDRVNETRPDRLRGYGLRDKPAVDGATLASEKGLWKSGDPLSDLLSEVARGMRGMLVDQDGNPLAFNVPVNAVKTKHFATFPESLIAPMVSASVPALSCSGCGAPYVRVVGSHRNPAGIAGGEHREARSGRDGGLALNRPRDYQSEKQIGLLTIGGLESGCTCENELVPGLVLDPFCGTGTAGVVALRQGKRFVGIELSPEYAEGAKGRLRGVKVERVAEVPSE